MAALVEHHVPSETRCCKERAALQLGYLDLREWTEECVRLDMCSYDKREAALHSACLQCDKCPFGLALPSSVSTSFVTDWRMRQDVRRVSEAILCFRC